MAKNRSSQPTQPPCCKGEIVTMDKVIEVINDDKYSDADTRTCFWLFAENLPKGKKVFDYPKTKKILSIMRQKRLTAHDAILEEAARTLARMK